MAETTTGAGSRTKVEPGIWFRLNATGRRVYEIVYRDSEGRQRQETIAGGLQDARTRLHDLKARLGKGERIVPNRRLTFAEASSAWIEAKAPNLAPKTIAIYSYALNVHLLPAFGRTKLADIDVRVVAKFVARMGGTEYRREVEARTGESKAQMGYSAQTIKSVLIPLSRTFAYAIRHLDHAGANPVAALDLDERPGYRQHRARKVKLGREDLDKLVAAAESPWREIICTALALGTRLGETLGLEWRHIDFAAGLITVEQQANAQRELARLKTETAYRKIEAPDWLLSLLRAWKLASKWSQDSELVFCTATGRPHGPGNVLGRGLYPALDRAGLARTSFHSLRHSHASLWIKDGGDAITLSRRLGHATPQITMTTYAAEIEEAQDNAARKARVEALFAGTNMATAPRLRTVK